MVEPTCNSSTGETEAGGLLQIPGHAWVIMWDPVSTLTSK